MEGYKYSVVIAVCLLALGDVVLGENRYPAQIVKTVQTVYIVIAVISAVFWITCLIAGCCCYRKRSKIVIPGRVLQAGQPGQIGMPVQQVYHQQQYMHNQPPPSYAEQKQNPSPYNTQAV